MGSVISWIDCPYCKSPDCFSDFYYKSGEEITACSECGYYHEISIKRNKEGKAILKDGQPKFVTYSISKPFGSYRLVVKEGVGAQIGSFKSKKEYNEFKEKVKEHSSEIEELTISRYVNGKIVKDVLIDVNPTVDSAGFTFEDNFNLN